MLYLKYYPKTFEDIIGNEKIKNVLQIMLEKQSFFNIILNGYNGCGKSTILKIFLSQVKKYKTISFNLSDIDFDEIYKNVQLNFPKIILLDNCTNLTVDLQQKLNKLLTISSKTVFIISTNNIESLIDTFKNSFFLLNFDYISDHILFDYFKKITVAEKLSLTDKKLKQIIFYSKNDYRKILNSISIHEDIDYSYENSLIKILSSNDLEKNIKSIDRLLKKGHSGLNIIKTFKSLIKLNLDNGVYDIDQFISKIDYLTQAEMNIYSGASDYIQLLSLIVSIGQI